MNLSWSEFLVLVRGWQSRPHNALAEALAGHSIWSVGEQLAAHLIDAIREQTWVLQRVNGAKSAKRPAPIPRPWDKKPQTYGAGALPYDEIAGWIESTYTEE